MTVLLIEDELILGETLVDALDLLGIGCTWVKSIKELSTLGMDENDPFTHIICDFYLPDGSFKDVYHGIFDSPKKFTHLSSSLPLIASSATVAEDDLGFIHGHATDFLPKPFSIMKLVEMLNKYDKTKAS